MIFERLNIFADLLSRLYLLLRKIAVAMHFEAYNGMGFMYKVKKGYFSAAVKQMWAHMPSKVKYGISAVGIATMAIGFMAVVNNKKLR